MAIYKAVKCKKCNKYYASTAKVPICSYCKSSKSIIERTGSGHSISVWVGVANGRQHSLKYEF